MVQSWFDCCCDTNWNCLLGLFELLLALEGFVPTVPSGVCSSTRSANLTFFLAGTGTGSCSPFNSSVLRNLYSLIEVVVSGHVPDNPYTALLVVIRWLQIQSRMLAPDTSVCVPVPR